MFAEESSQKAKKIQTKQIVQAVATTHYQNITPSCFIFIAEYIQRNEAGYELNIG